MAKLVEFSWLDSKGVASTNYLLIGPQIPVHVYEEYAAPEDVEKSTYISHPSLASAQKLETDIGTVRSLIGNVLKEEQ